MRIETVFVNKSYVLILMFMGKIFMQTYLCT